MRIVAGNWKMHGNRAENAGRLQAIVQGARSLAGVECVLCVPYPYLAQAAEALAGSGVALGAQDVSEFGDGAYTGEVSARMLEDFGCRYAIVGHSERRQHFGESDERVAAKFDAALRQGLAPILCVGETLAEREAGRTEEVLARQLDAVLGRAGRQAFARALIAYEPVWAIGTGRNATPGEAQAMHAFLRARALPETRIVYGGSLRASNAQAIFAMPDVDGGLVGGASLVAEEFLAICRAAGRKD